ncbi:MAG: acyl-CoA dehydrogenase family protein, partial [Polyangiaceae bacterium]
MTDELRQFRASVRNFLAREFVPNQSRWRAQHKPDPEAWRAAGAAGILLTDIPTAYGGAGGNFTHEAVVQEELVFAGTPFGCGVQSIVAHYILEFGTEEQKKKWLPAMARGELVAAIAMSEPAAGSDLQAIQTTARRDGDGWVLRGSKTFISNGEVAGLVCVAAKTDTKVAGPNSMSMIVVETKDLSGYSVARSLEKVGRQGQDTCELFFDDVRVPADRLLGGTPGKGFAQMMKQLPYERLQIAVSAIATTEHAVAVTTKYAKERVAFGKPLLHLQNTRFKLAECRTEAHIGRVFLDGCVQRFVHGELDPVTAAMAKYWLTECQFRVVDACVQMHGGYGYILEYPIARMWIDSRVDRIHAGSN